MQSRTLAYLGIALCACSAALLLAFPAAFEMGFSDPHDETFCQLKSARVRLLVHHTTALGKNTLVFAGDEPALQIWIRKNALDRTKIQKKDWIEATGTPACNDTGRRLFATEVRTWTASS